MELLRLLTLVYAAVLVLALAVSLITILVYLRRIAQALAGARASLERASTATAPLDRDIGRISRHIHAAHDALDAAASTSETLAHELETAAERRGIGATAR